MNNYYEVLKLKYLAEREEAKANLDLYFKSSIAIADHPDIIKTMDKLLNKFVQILINFNILINFIINVRYLNLSIIF